VQILADENVGGTIVGWLRGQRLDVTWVLEVDSGATDEDILARAYHERRILLTFDRDYGELVFRRGLRCAGVLLVRLNDVQQGERFNRFQKIWPVVAPDIIDNFVVVTHKRVRIRPLPP
jgi:predicted nuclease of predicted toxin-antitoxin system